MKIINKIGEELLKALKGVNMVDLSVYSEEQLKFPKESEVVRFIDKENNIDFQAKITNVKEGKTSIDKIIEFERIS